MPIKIDDADALERLDAKLKSLMELQDTMKGVNAIIRNTKMNDDEKIKFIKEKYNFSTERAYAIWQSRGFAPWQLSNNNQEINRIRKRIEEVIEYRKEVQKAANTNIPEFIFEGGKIVDNIPENRFQIFFDEKPDPETREKLKQHGFRWAPSKGAWQSYRKNYTLEWAKKEFEIKERITENE